MKKLKVGIFALTSCAGCNLSTIFLKNIDDLLQVFTRLDIKYFPLIGVDSYDGDFDVSFVEGTVVREEEIDKIKKIRDRSRILIALGTCATYGGVPSIRDFGFETEIKKTVYGDNICKLDSVEVYGIDKYVEIDYYLRGCPIEELEFIKIIRNLLSKKMVPRNIDFPVCKECRERNNVCLLQEGIFCLGPVTYGGCDARCPSVNIACYGCRGPLDDSNVEALIELFKEMKYSEEDIRRMFVKFAGTSKRYKNIMARWNDGKNKA